MVMSWIKSWQEMKMRRYVRQVYEDVCDQRIWANNNITDSDGNTIQGDEYPMITYDTKLYHVGQLCTNYNDNYYDYPVVGRGVVKTIRELQEEFPSDASNTQWSRLLKCIPHEWWEVLRQGNSMLIQDEWLATAIKIDSINVVCDVYST